MERAGHIVKTVDDGQQAVEAYLKDPSGYDVVLMGSLRCWLVYCIPFLMAFAIYNIECL